MSARRCSAVPTPVDVDLRGESAELRGALLAEAGDALDEVVAGDELRGFDERRHPALLARVLPIVEHLSLDRRHRARRTVAGEIASVFEGCWKQLVVIDDSVDQ